MRALLRAALVSPVCLVALASSCHAAIFRVDPSASSLVVQIFRDGVAAKFAHDHVVQATTFSGRVAYDPAAAGASSISVEVSTASLKADDPATRGKFRLAGGPTATDIADIERSMKAEGQLHVTKFPVITFTSTTITVETEGRYLVTGELTIRGVTRAVRFPAKVVMEGHALRGTATLELKQSTFGYKPYSALLGAIKNKDEVTLHIDLVAISE